MKKYIRTKDGIWQLSTFKGLTTKKNKNCESLLYENEKIIKESYTIEGLCEEFVYVGLNCPKVINAHNDFRCIDIDQVRLNISLHGGCLFGAIWVFDSNGAPTLKPVAKLNEKGKLELI